MFFISYLEYTNTTIDNINTIADKTISVTRIITTIISANTITLQFLFSLLQFLFSLLQFLAKQFLLELFYLALALTTMPSRHLHLDILAMLLRVLSAMLMGLLRAYFMGNLSAHLLRFIPARFTWFVPAFFMGNINASLMGYLPTFLVRLLPTFLVGNFLALTVNLFRTFLNVVTVLHWNLLTMLAMMNSLTLFLLLALLKQFMNLRSNVTFFSVSTRSILFIIFCLGDNFQ